jgi:Flp pilus assembly protein TadD
MIATSRMQITAGLDAEKREEALSCQHSAFNPFAPFAPFALRFPKFANLRRVRAIQQHGRVTAPECVVSLHVTVTAAVLALAIAGACAAQEIRVPLHKKSKYTPVQELNRQGVQAIEKHQIEKAKKLFYHAYLIDPNDPFTLNNLGYLAEIEGDVDRAQRYYDQARANTSEAEVDISTEDRLRGKPVAKIAGTSGAGPMKANQLNTDALRLLNQDRAPEADLVLQQALKLEPNNPFVLNNMGFAKEKEGELEQAINFYTRAAGTNSRELIVVTFNKEWRGRAISEVAADNADKTRKELARAGNVDERVARLNLQGVSAMNRNDRKAAREDFQKAFKLDPSNAFTINNMGYLAELEGDKETAQSYYEQAARARRNAARVAVSTRPEVEGLPMKQVAGQSTALVESSLDQVAEAKRRAAQPPALRTRDNRIVVDKPAPPSTSTPQTTQPRDEQPAQGAPQSDQPQKPPELKPRPPE